MGVRAGKADTTLDAVVTFHQMLMTIKLIMWIVDMRYLDYVDYVDYVDVHL